MLPSLRIGSQVGLGGGGGTSNPATPKSTLRPGTSPGFNPTGSVSTTQRDVSLKKDRVAFETLSEQLDIDFKAAHAKAAAQPGVLQRQFNLEAETAGNTVEETAQRLMARANQLKNEYQNMLKDTQRKHMELQQRRAAGARPDIPTIAPPSGATPQPPIVATPLAPSFTGMNRASTGSPVPAPKPILRRDSSMAANGTLSSMASAGMGGGGNSMLQGGASPDLQLGVIARPGAITDFARLDAMHDKHLSRSRVVHTEGIASRQAEVASWQSQHLACMHALSDHHAQSMVSLSNAVTELEAWHLQQRDNFATAHADVMADLDRLSRQLEQLQAGAAAKLQGLLATFVTERDLPPGEAGLAEVHAAHARAQTNLRAEHLALLEATEASLRAMLPRHGGLREQLANAYAAGVATHDATLERVLRYHEQGIDDVHSRYDSAEGRHREALAVLRSAHHQALVAVRDSYLGEAAALLEEYRARLSELRGTFLLAHEADCAEI